MLEREKVLTFLQDVFNVSDVHIATDLFPKNVLISNNIVCGTSLKVLRSTNDIICFGVDKVKIANLQGYNCCLYNDFDFSRYPCKNYKLIFITDKTTINDILKILDLGGNRDED